jgi:hypothetical protein
MSGRRTRPGNPDEAKGGRRDPVLALPRLGGQPPHALSTGRPPDATLLAASASWRFKHFSVEKGPPRDAWHPHPRASRGGLSPAGRGWGTLGWSSTIFTRIVTSAVQVATPSSTEIRGCAPAKSENQGVVPVQNPT